jgi:hypothetical protein
MASLFRTIIHKRSTLKRAPPSQCTLTLSGCPSLALVSPYHPMTPGYGAHALRVLINRPLSQLADFASPPIDLMLEWYALHAQVFKEGNDRPGPVVPVLRSLKETCVSSTVPIRVSVPSYAALDIIYSIMYVVAVRMGRVRVQGLTVQTLQSLATRKVPWLKLSDLYYTDADWKSSH